MSKKPTEIALRVDSDFAIAKVDGDKLKAIVQANLGNGEMNRFDLERLRIPTGGATAFETVDLTGATEYQKQIQCIVIKWFDTRSYWQNEFGKGEAGPPDCSSIGNDYAAGIGRGQPGGACKDCPWYQFGSKATGQGKGKACRETRSMFVLTKDAVLPTLLQLPPTSRGAAKREFFQRLTSRMLSFSDVLITVSLRKENKSGYEVAIADFKVDRILTPDEQRIVRAYADAIAPQLEERAPDHDDIAGTE